MNFNKRNFLLRKRPFVNCRELESSIALICNEQKMKHCTNPLPPLKWDGMGGVPGPLQWQATHISQNQFRTPDSPSSTTALYMHVCQRFSLRHTCHFIRPLYLLRPPHLLVPLLQHLPSLFPVFRPLLQPAQEGLVHCGGRAESPPRIVTHILRTTTLNWSKTPSIEINSNSSTQP